MSRRRKQRQNSLSATPATRVPGKKSPVRKPSSIRKWGLPVLGVVAALLVVAMIGGYFWIQSYLRSTAFRTELAKQVGGAIGGTARIEPLDWQGTAVSTSRVGLGSPSFGHWTTSDVEAVFDLSAFWQRTWHIESLTIARAEANWTSQPEATEPQPSPSEQAGTSQPKSRNSFLPNRSELSLLTIREFKGSYQTESGRYQWENNSLEAIPRGRTIDLTLTGGRLVTPFPQLGKIRLREATIRKNGGDLFLTRSDWRLLDTGRLDLRGSRLQDRSLLEGEVREVALEELFSPYWQQRISGEVASEIVFLKEGIGPPKVSAATSIANGTISSLPILNRLASYSANERLQRLNLEECRADIVWQPKQWKLQNIILEDEGLLRIEGNLQLAGEALSGELHVGVPPGLLARIPGAEEKVFFPGAGGLLWAPVQISGTLSRPQEDLSARMIQAAQERMFELIPETGVWALRYGADTLDEGTQLLLDNQGIILQQGTQAATQAVEQGTRVVEEGVKTGFGILNGILGAPKEEEDPE